MLRYHTKKGGYSISVPALQCWCQDPHGWHSHFRCVISSQVGNWFLVSYCWWHFWRSLPLHACDHQRWFKGWDQCWMPMGWCWLDHQQAAVRRIQSPQQIPLSFFTNNARKVIVHQNHSLFKGIPPYNWQWQPHYNFLNHQFAKHCRCNRGESLFKTHFICNQCSWHISMRKPISWWWIRWPKPGAPKIKFLAGLELNTCGQEHGHLLIGK